MERHIYGNFHKVKGAFRFGFGVVGGEVLDIGGGRVREAGVHWEGGYLFQLVGLEEAEELLVGPGVAG
jgi:hypothetical protein